MIALITGASSGMGRSFAKILARRGFNLVIVARRRQRLLELKHELVKEYGVKVKVLCHDLSDADECRQLYEEVEKANIDILINNAGFGVFGKFTETDLDSELKMLDVNIRAVHILTKLFLQKFEKRNYGYILNVASLAGFMAGPWFSSYYASKNYVLQLTKALYEELRSEHSNVYIGAFCPGPVNTEFNNVAGAEFAVGGLDEMQAAEYAIDKMFDGQLIIVPSLYAKLITAAAKVAPTKVMLAATGKVQRARTVHEHGSELEPPVNTGADMKLRLTEEELDQAIAGMRDDIKDINGI
ncbi:MAG: SDR family oxidoreductase [Ruminiclostridium sp.]|nr:SDR family oxidoreductase [Ruminiclostridium sp.]